MEQEHSCHTAVGCCSAFSNVSTHANKHTSYRTDEGRHMTYEYTPTHQSN